MSSKLGNSSWASVHSSTSLCFCQAGFTGIYLWKCVKTLPELVCVYIKEKVCTVVCLKRQFTQVQCVCVYMWCLWQRVFLVLVGPQVHVVLVEPLAWDLIEESWRILTVWWWHQLQKKSWKVNEPVHFLPLIHFL